MSQIHKRFTDEQVKALLDGYCQGKLKRTEIQQLLEVGKTRFFALVKAYRQSPASFSVAYQRKTHGRLPDEPELGPAPALCQPGQGLIEDGEGCELCPPGTFNGEAGQVECETCPVGTYQDEAGGTECKACPPLEEFPDGEPIPESCMPLTPRGIIAGAPEQVPPAATEPSSGTPEADEPAPEATPTPYSLTGTWYWQASEGTLTCPEYTKTVTAMFGNVSVEYVQGDPQMIMHGVPEFSDLVLTEVEEIKFQAIVQVEGGTVTVTVYRRLLNLLESEILGNYGPG